MICHATRRAELPSDAARIAALTKAGAAGIMAIADPGFVVEPPRWPFAYMRSVTLAGSPTPSSGLVNFRLNASALGKVIQGSGQDAAALIETGSAGKPLSSFDLPHRVRARFTTARRTYSSPNVIGMLPGTVELLTVHALDDTSLGDDAREVASELGITVQNDPEPERRLLQRSDHWTFLQAGVPAINFVFGFRPGGESERIYRRWYREGYHTPQDDPNQQIDWKAAADFNRFFYRLVERVADQESAPAWKAGSELRPTGYTASPWIPRPAAADREWRAPAVVRPPAL